MVQDINLRNYAYIGDAIWELFVREKTIFMTNNSQKLHQITTFYVKTGYQCELLHKMNNMLTAEEQELVKRARNLPIPVGRKNIQQEYRQATAFETLIGWWYFHDKNRLNSILENIKIDSNITNQAS